MPPRSPSNNVAYRFPRTAVPGREFPCLAGHIVLPDGQYVALGERGLPVSGAVRQTETTRRLGLIFRPCPEMEMTRPNAFSIVAKVEHAYAGRYRAIPKLPAHPMGKSYGLPVPRLTVPRSVRARIPLPAVVQPRPLDDVSPKTADSSFVHGLILSRTKKGAKHG